MSRTALIVDDSPLARHVLSRLLAEHGIEADTVPSAEEALEYLKLRRPDVVFMDHLMPGMDGFEALEAIKANPATATIPVMMYTSQEGELYVGQARALGAFGVLPKDLKPTEVTKVLQALRLVGAESARKTDPAPEVPVPTDAAESQRVKALLEELFYQQRAALREEIQDGYERAINSAQSGTYAAVYPMAGRPANVWLRAAAVGFVILSAVLALLYANTSRSLRLANQESVLLREQLSQQTAAGAAQPQREAAQMQAADESMLSALEWAVRFSGEYPFGALPLDDRRAEQIGQLMQYLDAVGFAGLVSIEVHVGQFCMSLSEEGEWRLAPDSQPIDRCDQMGWSASDAEDIGARQSIGFANMLATATRQSPPQIDVLSWGAAQPIVPYPAVTSYVSAGDWNAIAATNQRVEIRFLK